MGRVDKMQREEVAQQGNRRRDAHHGFADEGEDRKEGDGFRTQMHHVDLIVGKHDVEEIKKGRNQTRPQGVGEILDLGDYPVDGEVRRGPGRRPPAFIEDGGQSQADLAQALSIEYGRLADGGGHRWWHTRWSKNREEGEARRDGLEGRALFLTFGRRRPTADLHDCR